MNEQQERALRDGLASLAATARQASASPAVERAVLTLPLRYREAVVLCDLQELSYLDAAAALDCPVGTVRSRLNRGRALLTAKMLAEQQRKARPLARVEGVTRCLA